MTTTMMMVIIAMIVITSTASEVQEDATDMTISLVVNVAQAAENAGDAARATTAECA